MKKLKKVLPIFVFVAMMSLTTAVFASKSYITTVTVGQGKTVKVQDNYNMPEKGTGRLYYNITKIDGSSNSNVVDSTKLHLILRDSNDTAIIDAYRDYDQTWYGSDTKIDGTTVGAKGEWYAQVSTKINGLSYSSFYSNYFAIISLT